MPGLSVGNRLSFAIGLAQISGLSGGNGLGSSEISIVAFTFNGQPFTFSGLAFTYGAP